MARQRPIISHRRGLIIICFILYFLPEANEKIANWILDNSLQIEVTAFDNQVVDEETGFTSFDVDRFGDELFLDTLDVESNPRPRLVEPKDIPHPTAFNRSISDARVVIFNKNRKVASTMLTNVFKLLGKCNGFQTVTFPNTNLAYNFPWSLSIEEERSMVSQWESYTMPTLFSAHMYYIDSLRYVHNITFKPIWINLVRDPVERLVSLYYHKRRTKFWQTANMPSDAWFNRPFIDCFNQQLEECKFDSSQFKEQQLTHFCGNALECRQVGNLQALQRAKYNLETKFAVVGLFDHIEKTLILLSAFIPSFFADLKEAFKAKGALNNQEEFRMNVQEDYPKLNGTDWERVADKIPMEMDLYQFAKARFHLQCSKLRQQGYNIWSWQTRKVN